MGCIGQMSYRDLVVLLSMRPTILTSAAKSLCAFPSAKSGGLRFYSSKNQSLEFAEKKVVLTEASKSILPKASSHVHRVGQVHRWPRIEASPFQCSSSHGSSSELSEILNYRCSSRSYAIDATPIAGKKLGRRSRNPEREPTKPKAVPVKREQKTIQRMGMPRTITSEFVVLQQDFHDG
jgi:hypothetical protein